MDDQDAFRMQALETFVFADDRLSALRSAFAPNSEFALFLQGMLALHQGNPAEAAAFAERLPAERFKEVFKGEILSNNKYELELRALLAELSLVCEDAKACSPLLLKLRSLCGPDIRLHTEASCEADTTADSDTTSQNKCPTAIPRGNQVSFDAFLNDGLSGHDMEFTDYIRCHIFRSQATKKSSVELLWSLLLGFNNPAAVSGLPTFIAQVLHQEDDAPTLAETHGFSLKRLNLTRMTLEQLKDIGTAYPTAQSYRQWQAAVVRKMRPVQAKLTRAESLAYLEDVLSFCDNTDATQTQWLRLRTLHAQLLLQEASEGAPHLQTTMAFLRLLSCSQQSDTAAPPPTQLAFVSQVANRLLSSHRTLQSAPDDRTMRDSLYGNDCDTGPLLPPVPVKSESNGVLERLLSALLARAIAEDRLEVVRKALQTVIDPTTEQQLVAQALLLAGAPSASSAAALLPDPQKLQDAVELAFTSRNETVYVSRQPVSLHMCMKNVPQLLLRVFDINTWAYLTTTLEEVPLHLELDGLGASHELSFDFATRYPPMQRHQEIIPLDKEDDGVFIVEAIGGGLKSRALIRRGSLSHLERISPAGIAVTIFDSPHHVVPDGRVFVDGETYAVDPSTGEAIVPFAKETQHHKAVVIGMPSGFATLAHMTHYKEDYTLRAGFHVEREALKPIAVLPLLLWVALDCAGSCAAPLKLLQDVHVVAAYKTTDHNSSTQQLGCPQLTGRHASLQLELRTPDRCASVEVRLAARVQLAVGVGERFQDLSASKRWDITELHADHVITDLHMRRAPNGSHLVEALGRCGEAEAPETAVQLKMKHSLVPGVTLAFPVHTDSHGTIALGALEEGLSEITADLGDEYSGIDSFVSRTWKLSEAAPVLPDTINLAADSEDEFVVPGCGTPGGAFWTHPAQLLSCSSDGQEICHDVTAACICRAPGGQLALRHVPAGTHQLHLLKMGKMVRVNAIKTATMTEHRLGQVLAGDSADCGPLGIATQSQPLMIVDLKVTVEDGLSCKVSGAKAATAADMGGVQVMAAFSRFLPTDNDVGVAKAAGAASPGPQPCQLAGSKEGVSEYSSGLPLSEEMQYCLQRRQLEQQGKVRAGSLGDNPSLLVHPWSLGRTHAKERVARHPRAPQPVPPPHSCHTLAAPGGPGANNFYGFDHAYGGHLSCVPRLGFCPAPALITDVQLEDDGMVSLSPEELRSRGADLVDGGFTYVTLLATSRSGDVASAVCHVGGGTMPRQMPIADQGLMRPLQRAKPYIQVSGSTALLPGNCLRLKDAHSLRVNFCDSAEKLWTLYGTLLHGNSWWAEFGFLPKWGGLSQQQRLEHLGRCPCHELHFFVYHRDRDLFNSHVLPLLQAKLPGELQPTDLWLLGRREELWRSWSPPHRAQSLNALERILLAEAGGPTALQRCARDMRAEVRQSDKKQINAVVNKKRFETALLAGDGGEIADPVAAQVLCAPQQALFASAPPRSAQAQARYRRRPVPRGIAERTVPADWVEVPGANEEEEQQAEDADDDAEEAADLELRAKQQRLQALRKRPLNSQEWGEAGYWKQHPRDRTQKYHDPLVPISAFWADYAEHLAQHTQNDGSAAPLPTFLSGSPETAARTSTDAALALAVVGLQLEAPEPPQVESSEEGLTFTATAPTIVFHRQVQEAPEPQQPTAAAAAPAAAGGGGGVGLGASVTIVQRLVDIKDRRIEDEATGEMVDRPVVPPLQTGHPYAWLVILTSAAAGPQNVDLLVQAPQGAVALGNEPSTWHQRILLQPYATHIGELTFYFPHPGAFGCVPSTVAKAGTLIAAATVPDVITVQTEPGPQPATTAGFDWRNLARTASDAEIIQYLQDGDLTRADMCSIASRCQRRSFFLAATAALRQRCSWHLDIWSYAVIHGGARELSELLPMCPSLTKRVVPPLDNPLLRLPAKGHTEVWPLVIRRVHALGRGPALEDTVLRREWLSFLQSAARQASLSPINTLKAIVFLLVQGRIDEGEWLFKKLKSADDATRDSLPTMQMDYLEAWLALAQSPPNIDTRLVQVLSDKYPAVADRLWAQRWTDLRGTLAEAASPALPAGAAGGAGGSQGGLTSEAESLLVTPGPVEGQVTLSHSGISSVRLSAYQIDMELLFSSDPFCQARGSSSRSSSRFAFVKPCATAEVAVDRSSDTTVVSLSDTLPSCCSGGRVGAVMLEARGGTLPPYTCLNTSSRLRVRVLHVRSAVLVTAPITAGNNAYGPAVAVYCKVFSRRHGQSPNFHKDGYTDVRGMFDYRSITTPGDIPSGTGFAVLIASERWGFAIEEIDT